jgi:hypothetical protein
MIVPTMILPIFRQTPERSGERQSKLARRVINASELAEFQKIMLPELYSLRQPTELPHGLYKFFSRNACDLSHFGLHSCSLPRRCLRRSVVPIRAIRGLLKNDSGVHDFASKYC